MKSQTIEFVALTERIKYSEYVEAYQFRKDRPARMLQKICFFILRKLRAFKLDSSITIERHTVDPVVFIERLFKQKQNIQQMFDMRPTTLLIGAEDYAELMDLDATIRMFEFRSEYGYGREICGLTVKVIPWMRGILVMPNI